MADTETLVLRDLEKGDFNKGFMTLLGQLTDAGNVKQHDFENLVDERDRDPAYKTVVIEDTEKGTIIATATLLIEKKFIHGISYVGHVEDVVVDETYRGKRLGVRVIDALSDHAQKAGCYKVILDCKDSNVPFYDKCGFQRKEVQCVKYFH